MAVTCTGKASGKISWNWLDARADGSNTKNSKSLSALISYTGTDVDNVFTKTYAIAGAGTQVLDLSGVLTDPGNNTITWTKVMAIILKLTNATTASAISFGPHTATNPLAGLMADTSDKIKIYNGGAIVWFTPAATPLTVTGGSADNLLITNLDATNVATVFVALLGKA